MTPPRLLAEQQAPELSARLFETARLYWLDPASDRMQDPQQPKAAAAAARAAPAAAGAAPKKAAAAVGSAGVDDSSDVQPRKAASVPGSGSNREAAATDSDYRKLVAKYSLLSERRDQQLQRQQPASAPGSSSSSSGNAVADGSGNGVYAEQGASSFQVTAGQCGSLHVCPGTAGA